MPTLQELIERAQEELGDLHSLQTEALCPNGNSGTGNSSRLFESLADPTLPHASFALSNIEALVRMTTVFDALNAYLRKDPNLETYPGGEEWRAKQTQNLTTAYTEYLADNSKPKDSKIGEKFEVFLKNNGLQDPLHHHLMAASMFTEVQWKKAAEGIGDKKLNILGDLLSSNGLHFGFRPTPQQALCAFGIIQVFNNLHWLHRHIRVPTVPDKLA